MKRIFFILLTIILNSAAFASQMANPSALSISTSLMTLSVSGYLEYGIEGTPSSGLPRTLTITNTGSNTAENLSVTYPAWPTGTEATSDCGNTLAPGASCTITITPGPVATSDGQNPCTVGTSPNPQIITAQSDNTNQVGAVVYILGYGCQYQSGYVFYLDDTPAANTLVQGKMAQLTDALSATWSDALSQCSYGFHLPSICELGYYITGAVNTKCGPPNAPQSQNIQSNLINPGMPAITNTFDMSAFYWSETEFPPYASTRAYVQKFDTKEQEHAIKTLTLAIRCIRNF